MLILYSINLSLPFFSLIFYIRKIARYIYIRILLKKEFQYVCFTYRIPHRASLETMKQHGQKHTHTHTQVRHFNARARFRENTILKQNLTRFLRIIIFRGNFTSLFAFETPIVPPMTPSAPRRAHALHDSRYRREVGVDRTSDAARRLAKTPVARHVFY